MSAGFTAQAQKKKLTEIRWDKEFQHASDEYFDQVYFPFQPTAGTMAGYHQYDARLEDLSAPNLHAQIAALHKFERRFEEMHDKGTFNLVNRGDCELVLGNIRSTLLTLETIRTWEKDPDSYTTIAANGIFTLMERKFAQPDARLRSVVAREQQIPKLIAAARANLSNPPRIYTEIAIEQLPDNIQFFEHDVPAAFTDAKDAALKEEFTHTNALVVSALKDYLVWLKSDMLQKSNGDFRIGADTFSKKLEYDEMVDLPLDKLLEIGWADLRKNQEHFKQVAKEIEPDKDPRAVLDELGAMHPAPDKLIPTFTATFDGLIGFIQSHHIVTIPSTVRPIVEETPPFMRATTFASMDTPGPYEKHATEAYFNVTLPDKSMTPAEVEGYMHAFNIGTVVSTAVHEAYPGHYVQFLWVPQAPSRVRKLLGANSNAEGWAHYCEQMMVDEGFGGGDLRIRLAQLQEALLRDCRYVVGIKLHTAGWTVEQGAKLFVDKGFQEPANAYEESRRGTYNPLYLYYTFGKLEIQKLRDDYLAKKGGTLRDFHDAFVVQGGLPLSAMRKLLLGE